MCTNCCKLGKSEMEADLEAVGFRNTFFVRGVSFRQKELASVEEGMYVLLVPEPTNPHDSDAIKVMVITKGEPIHIGYVPKELTRYVRPLVDQFENGEDDGGYWDAMVDRIVPGDNGPGVSVVFYADSVIPKQVALNGEA